MREKRILDVLYPNNPWPVAHLDESKRCGLKIDFGLLSVKIKKQKL